MVYGYETDFEDGRRLRPDFLKCQGAGRDVICSPERGAVVVGSSVGSSGPIKISDVALAAGVSVATVSKALNGRSDVSAATRARVEAVAAQLQFRPNALAGSLRTGRSFSVGLLTTDSFGRFSIPIMLGAEDGLGSGDVAILFCDSRDDQEREARQIQALGVSLPRHHRAPCERR